MIRFNKKNVSKGKKYHIGEIRKSQLISTFGVGSIVDFVKETAVIGGIDNWDKDENYEERRINNENLQTLMGVNYFLEPKSTSGQVYSSNSQDIEAYTFPRKLYCPVCKSIIDSKELSAQKDRHRCNQMNAEGKRCNGHLVASRFVVICENGHIDDFPYSWWVHRGSECSSGKKSQRIFMYNFGNRSDVESLILECKECGSKRNMSGVFHNKALSGENGICCSGKHPHLGDDYKEECSCVPVVKLRSSSSVYFPVNYSALLIPPWSQRNIGIIEKYYNNFSYIADDQKENYIRNEIHKKYSNISVNDLLDAYEILKKRRESGKERTESDIYEDEYKILCKDNINEDRFASHSVDIPSDFTNFFESVSAVDRLVVTMAMKGFTRLHPYNDSEKEKVAPLSKNETDWLPAVELNGEGIFIRFRKEAIEEWVKNTEDRYDELTKSHRDSFLKSNKYSQKYVMLHSFSHLLIRQLSNECGYSMASMCEKIYSDFTDGSESYEMNGILIYLSSSDSDGSLGGLVNAVEDTELFDKILKNALREARWCSADPLCSLSKHQGFVSLNYAACHACTLLPETSCEFNNLLLDRISVVGKPENPELGIMGRFAMNL